MDTTSATDRLLASVRKNAATGCWSWSGQVSNSGCGRTNHVAQPGWRYALGECTPGQLLGLRRARTRRYAGQTHLRQSAVCQPGSSAAERIDDRGLKAGASRAHKAACRRPGGTSSMRGCGTRVAVSFAPASSSAIYSRNGWRDNVPRLPESTAKRTPISEHGFT